jgi:tyrosine-protein kinase Etk/Wzc
MPEDSNTGDDEIDLLDLTLVLAENAKLLIFGPVAVGLCALGISFLVPPTFTATARLLTPQLQQSTANILAGQLQSLGGLGGAASAFPGLKNPGDLYVGLLKSRSVADALVDEFKLREVYEEDYSQDARKQLAKRSRITAGKDGIIAVEVDDHDRERAARLANAYVSQLQALMERIAVTEAGQRRLFFDKQLAQAREDLTRAETALRAVGVNEGNLKVSPESTLGALARLKAMITASEVRLSAMRGAMTEANPDLRGAERELNALKAQLANAEQQEGPSGKDGSNEYIRRLREFKYRETLFEFMTKQYELARLDEAREGVVIQMVDAAIPPERKSKPQKGLISIIATLAAGAVLALFVFARNALRAAATDPATAWKLQRLRQPLHRGKPAGLPPPPMAS